MLTNGRSLLPSLSFSLRVFNTLRVPDRLSFDSAKNGCFFYKFIGYAKDQRSTALSVQEDHKLDLSLTISEMDFTLTGKPRSPCDSHVMLQSRVLSQKIEHINFQD